MSLRLEKGLLRVCLGLSCYGSALVRGGIQTPTSCKSQSQKNSHRTTERLTTGGVDNDAGDVEGAGVKQVHFVGK